MKIGMLYNLVDNIERGLEIDKLSDNEIIETVEHVKRVLEKEYEVIPVRVNRKFLPKLSSKSFDFVFNLCEGIDGNVKGETWIPAFLDMIEVPYTGSDSLTLGLCLDKIKAKQLFIANNIPTPRYQIFHTSPLALDPDLKFPLIIKPAHEDASVGITSNSVVQNKRDLFKQVTYILKTYHQPALVEEYIDGRELSVAIIGNEHSIEVLPVSEIIFNFEKNIPRIDSYESKWLKDSEVFQKTEAVCPTELPKDAEAQIKKLAVDAYNIVGCRDYATLDFRLNDNALYLLEINPNPSIGIKTSFAQSANNMGLSYDELIHRILSEAMKRYDFKAFASKKADIIHECSNIIASSVRLEHVPLLTKWFNDSDISKYMDASEGTCSEEGIIESFLISNQDDINFVISEKENKKGIGFCSIYNINRSNQSAEISFLIGEKQFQGKGYGKETVKLLLSIAFHKLGLNRIFATATQKNERSVRVFEKTGFRKIGVMREYHVLDGEKLDEFLFEIIKDDYMRLYSN